MITASKMAKCQKQKISGYIFVVLFLVARTEATETEDILDPDLAEGLVALQPVLKDHLIDYRNVFLPRSCRQTLDQNSKVVLFDYFHLTKFLQFTEFKLA